MSIFITSAVLKFIHGMFLVLHSLVVKFPVTYLSLSDLNIWFSAILDVVFTWKARCTMDYNRRRKDVLKILGAMIWIIILPIFYTRSRRKYTCYSTQNRSWLGEWCYSSYMVAVAFYLVTNGVNMVLFLVPAVGRYIETSNTRVCSVLSWFAQVRDQISLQNMNSLEMFWNLNCCFHTVIEVFFEKYVIFEVFFLISASCSLDYT